MYRSMHANVQPFGDLARNTLSGAVGYPSYYKPQAEPEPEPEDNTGYVVGGVAAAALVLGGIAYLGLRKKRKK